MLKPVRSGVAPLMVAAPSNFARAPGAESGSENEIGAADPELETDASAQAQADLETEAEAEPASATGGSEVPAEADSDPKAGTESEGTDNP
jgi:hypothetical protein